MSSDRSKRIDKMFANMSAMKRIMVCYLRSDDDKDRLPPSQGELLLLAQQDTPLTLKQLAELMRLTPGAVSQLVESLERSGLVRREPSQQDRRVVNIAITAEGERKIAAMKQRHAAIFKQMAEALSDDELDAMINIQSKMIDHLKKTHHEAMAQKENA